MAVEVFCPAAAPVGEVLSVGDQSLMQMAGEHGMQLGPGWLGGEWGELQFTGTGGIPWLSWAAEIIDGPRRKPCLG